MRTFRPALLGLALLASATAAVASLAAAQEAPPPAAQAAQAFPLNFEISPPLDWLGKPWRAIVFKADLEKGGSPSFVFNDKVAADGRFSVANQGPGVYRVDILDSQSSSLSSTEHHRSQDAPEPTRLKIEFVPVQGTLRLGKNPLANTALAFGGRLAPVSIRMRSEDDGSFSGVLPHSGEWPVEIQGSEPNVLFTLQTSVPPRSPDGSAAAPRIDLVLPATRIAGRVVDAKGKPEQSAIVTLQGGAFTLTQTTDSAGKFELQGLPEGKLTLSAESLIDGATSPKKEVELAAGKPTAPVELRLGAAERP